MFSEVLRIKPVLDAAAASQMEVSLSKRFTRIATGFGRGLKTALKVSALGIGLALLQKLLSPLSEMEERIKKLLGEGHEVQDLADRLGTGQGLLRLVQGVAASVGVKPDKAESLFTSFAKAIELARTEEKSAEGIHSPEAVSVKEFRDSKNILAAFLAYTQSLKELPKDEQRKHQVAVFGEEQFGAARKFLNVDFREQSKKIGAPAVIDLEEASQSVNGLNTIHDETSAANALKNFIRTVSKTSPEAIRGIEAQTQREEQFAIDRIGNIKQLLKGAKATEDIKEIIEQNLDSLLAGAGALEKLTGVLLEISQMLHNLPGSRLFRQVPAEK